MLIHLQHGVTGTNSLKKINTATNDLRKLWPEESYIKENESWSYNSVEESLPSMNADMGSSPSYGGKVAVCLSRSMFQIRPPP